MRIRVVVAAAVVLGGAPLSTLTAQEVWPLDCDTCSQPKKIDLAAAEVALINVVVNVFNRVTRGEEGEFAYVSPASWLRNIEIGWEFDDNNFSTNMFAHPFHGATYFNAARSNGLDYWASSPFAFGGSLMWEYIGETHLPAPNDFIATSIGGIALGEMQYRVSSLILDNTATGSSRIWRELGATLVNPVRGFNRLIHGDMGRVGANPPDRFPKEIRSLWDFGGRPVADSVSGTDPSEEGTKRRFYGAFNLWYGNPHAGDHKKPFESFEMRLQLNAVDKATLGRLQVYGLLYGDPLSEPRTAANPRKPSHLFAVTQHYDYLNNQAFELGGQAFGMGLLSSFPLGGGFSLSSRVLGSFVLLGGIRSPYAEIVGRTYDFGTGLGLQGYLMGWHKGRQVLELAYWGEWLRVIDGTPGDHLIHVLSATARFPIVSFFGAGANLTHAIRNGYFPDFPDITETGPPFGLFITFFTDR
jgi:hypothetical protein